MKIIILSFLMVLNALVPLWGQTAEQNLAAADKAFQAGDQAGAEKLYRKAAEEGSAEAHFALGYKFSLPGNEGLIHFIEAAKMGHEKALDSALEGLLLRADSLKNSDPQKALDLYETAKKANPNLKLFDEEGTVKILKMCAEPKGFDADAFIKKYGITDEEMDGYGIWELAAEASKGGRFGKPDPLLVFNLVMRGSQVPAELAGSVEATYKNWKKGVVKVFDPCDFITSGMGQGYCARREEEKAEAKRAAKEKSLIVKWPKDQQKAFDVLKKASADYFEARSRNEVDLSGTARGAFVIEEEDSLKVNFQKALTNFEKGKFPQFTGKDFKITDYKLNDLYSRIMKLKDLQNGTVTPEGVRMAQVKWLPYRDAWVRFATLRYPGVSSESLKTWLAQERLAQLEDLGSVLKRSADGIGTTASFYNPAGLAVDNSGNVYVADSGNSKIRKINLKGVVTTLAGGGTGHATNGMGPEASFWSPHGIVVDNSGNVFVADSATDLIRKITPEGLVSTYAGQEGVRGIDDGPVSKATFQNPLNLALDTLGVIYVADGGRLRKITPKGIVTTIPGSVDIKSYIDRTGTGSKAYFAGNVAVDSFGNVYITDDIFLIQKITPKGEVLTLAGSAGFTGSTDGMGTNATFNYPSGLAIDTSGNIYVSESSNNKIRKITPAGYVTTLAGSGAKSSTNGKGVKASILRPRGIAVDNSGNVYVGDGKNQIRKITPDGIVTTLAGIAHD